MNYFNPAGRIDGANHPDERTMVLYRVQLHGQRDGQTSSFARVERSAMPASQALAPINDDGELMPVMGPSNGKTEPGYNGMTTY